MSQHIVIVGAGVIGLSTAYYCARRGFRVTVLERNPAQRDGCSYGNAGMIVPSHFVPLAAPGMVTLALKWMWNPASPFYIKPRLDLDLLRWGLQFWRAATLEHVQRAAPLLRDLTLASRACFEELAHLPQADFGLVQKGLLMLCRTTHGLHDEANAAERARALGIPAQVLDARQTAALDPDALLDIVGAVHYPLDCHLVPDRFMAALEAATLQLGATFLWDTEVVGWRTHGRRVQAIECCGRQAVGGDAFVLCGGSWAALLARGLGIHLPMQAGKGYSLTLSKPRQLPQLCSICTEARLAVTPMAGRLRVGGTMELAGLNEEISRRRVQQIIRSFCQYFPKFQPIDFDEVQPWGGLRPCSPDGLPFVGPTARFTNLLMAAGHAMMGLSLGPITGQIIATHLAGERPPWNIALLSPDRYG